MPTPSASAAQQRPKPSRGTLLLSLAAVVAVYCLGAFFHSAQQCNDESVARMQAAVIAVDASDIPPVSAACK